MQVSKGQAIASIDDTRFRCGCGPAKAGGRQPAGQYHPFKGRAGQLLSVGVTIKTGSRQIEIHKNLPEYPQDLKSNDAPADGSSSSSRNISADWIILINQLAIQSQQMRQRKQEMSELASKITTLEISHRLAIRELDLTRPLAEKNIVSKIELYKLERSVNELKGELNALRLLTPKLKSAFEEAALNRRETALSYKKEARAKLNELQNKLAQMNEAQVGTQDKVTKALILSPVIGTIKTVHINTLGGVVKPGEAIVEIVPTQDRLMVEAKIKPSDIAFISPGLPAVVKITAYDFARYGALTGKVEHISADTTQDEEGNSFYLIRVRTDAPNITNKAGEAMPIIPGMMTQVDVITGKRTILEYILHPILRANIAALREG